MGRQHYVQRLATLERSVDELGELVLQTIDASLATLQQRDVSRAKKLIEDDSHVDRMRHDIEEQAFVLIATQQPAATDLRSIMAAATVAGELERIADYCSGIAKITLTMAQEPV